MKRFAYACLGILALVLAFHIGAQTGQAGAPGIISVGLDTPTETFVLLNDGRIWRWHMTVGWSEIGQLPFPTSNLQSFTGTFAVDASNGGLWRESGGIPLQWEFLGQPPGTAGVGDAPHLKPSTWGKVKAQAR